MTPFLRLPGVPRERWRVTLASRRRLVLDEFFAPRREPVACFEPMAAPADALVSGDGLAWAPWRMRFEIRVI